MIDKVHIKGVIFDYGGTIDSNGVHWAEVIRGAYQDENVHLTDEVFREAYVHGERTLGRNPIIRPHHTFLDMMRHKIRIQFAWLAGHGHLSADEALQQAIAQRCYDFAARATEAAKPVIEAVAAKYPIALVSNFYGNIAAVLHDFGLDSCFGAIIESAVAGVRKPDPQIFRLGAEALQLPENVIAVVGDSYDKDIVPATQAGFKTIWLKKKGWSEYTGDETADAVINDFADITELLI